MKTTTLLIRDTTLENVVHATIRNLIDEYQRGDTTNFEDLVKFNLGGNISDTIIISEYKSLFSTEDGEEVKLINPESRLHMFLADRNEFMEGDEYYSLEVAGDEYRLIESCWDEESEEINNPIVFESLDRGLKFLRGLDDNEKPSHVKCFFMSEDEPMIIPIK